MGTVRHDNDTIMITVIVIFTNNKFVRVRMNVESQTHRRQRGAYFFQKNTIIIIFQNIKNALIIDNNVIIDRI